MTSRQQRKGFAKTMGYPLSVTVYIEIVIFNNLIVDLLLGVTTCLLRRRKPKRLRQTMSSIIGTVVAVIYPLVPAVPQILIKVFLAPLLALIVDKYTSPKDYLKSLGIFVVLTYFLGGCVVGINTLLGVDIRGYVVLGVLALSVLVLEVVVWFVLLKKPEQNKVCVDVSVKYKGKILWFKAFYDSGNTLTDTLTGLPVVILSQSAVNTLKESGTMTYDGFVQVKTVNGESSLPIIEFEEIRCGQRAYHCFGAISEQTMDNYDLILQNTLTYK